MNFEFSEEQQFIRDQAANFLRDQCSPAEVRSILETDTSFHEQIWSSVVDLGWTAMTIPEAYEGLGLGFLELCVIAEELGRALAPIPFSSSVYLATEALKLAASEEQKQHWLPKLAAGELIGTLATAEQAGTLAVSASVTNGHLSGIKSPVPDGDIANFAIVAANNENGELGLYLADLTDASVTRSALESMDPSRSQASVEFTNTPVTALGENKNGLEHLNRVLDQAAVLFAFEQIGGAQAAMNMGIEYTKNRYAFGRQVASFQAIKHKFADMFVALELAKSNAYYGAWALSSGAQELPLAAATARVSAIDAYYFISKENIQAHGGMGFTWEFDCHLYYRRAQLLSSVIGASPEWKEKLVNELMANEQIISEQSA